MWIRWKVEKHPWNKQCTLNSVYFGVSRLPTCLWSMGEKLRKLHIKRTTTKIQDQIKDFLAVIANIHTNPDTHRTSFSAYTWCHCFEYAEAFVDPVTAKGKVLSGKLMTSTPYNINCCWQHLILVTPVWRERNTHPYTLAMYLPQFIPHSVVLGGIEGNIVDHIIGQLLRKPANW